MLVHIVLFKFKDFAEGNSKEVNLAKAKESLEKLPAIIKEIKHFEVGINSKDASQTNFDLAIYSKFDNIDGLNVYTPHPEHVKVSSFIKSVIEGRSCVDYEI